MPEETLDQLVDRAASETASALHEQRLSPKDRRDLASTFRGRGGAEAMTALGVEVSPANPAMHRTETLAPSCR